MKKTSLPRLFANAALLAAMVAPAVSLHAQVSTQSYLRNTPSEIEREDPRVQAIIARADEHYKLGELNLRDNKRQAAREEFDKAVDSVLESGMDVRSNPRLQHYYLMLVENIYRYEVPQGVPAQRQQNGASFVEVAQGGNAQTQQEPPQVGFT
ncbi:MAG TPA: hypothetical protein VE821_06030, partial [Pyrinomonadaceae bacterium]|nr:hypothetical protein [Pyrinomonadaceae bacterium]